MKIYFVESSFPAQILKLSEKDLIFVRDNIKGKFKQFNCKIISIKNNILYKVLKVIFLIQPWGEIYTQGGPSLGYKISKHKNIISDGILTEVIINRGLVDFKKFIGISGYKTESIKKESQKNVIIGNNYLSFRSMRKKTYTKYLLVLKKKYPGYEYWLHPREDEEIPKKIFGKESRKHLLSSEDIIQDRGVNRIVVPLASTMAVTLSKIIGMDKIEFISPDIKWYDGEVADLIESKKINKKAITEVRVNELESMSKKLISNEIKITRINATFY